MEEKWKDIKGYDGDYQISNYGRVKSFKKNKEMIIKGSINGKNKPDDFGYLFHMLSKNGKKKSYSKHILVWDHFGNKERGMLDVDHKDNNSLNNNIDNLQLLSHRENCSKDKKGYTSEYTGVYYRKSRNKWQSNITISGKSIYLGIFKTEYDAHLAYQQKLKDTDEY